jgi:Tol biopolymer transport system component
MSLQPSTRLGPYEIVAAIGAGGMGEVYRARDTKLGREVAIKVLPDAFAHDAERMARFEREAQVLASLNHPNIAAIYGLEESSEVRALVMELVEGPTLADRIAQGPVPLDEALVLAKQMAEGLEYAHERGIIHRDLKPANIKLTTDGTVKLLDFGLAKAVEEPVVAGNPSISPTLTIRGTSAGVILGTAAYMAPEQARGAVVDKRADIWAFGVVLYELLTAKQPFVGSTVSDTLAGVLKTDPDLGAIPACVRGLVRRCVEKDAKRRMRDIGEARLAIEELLAGRMDGAETPQTSLRRSILWQAVVGALAVVSLTFGALFWRATRPVSQPLVRLDVQLGPEFQLSTVFSANAILSPDGTRVVYTGRNTDGKLRLYTRLLAQEHAAPMAGTEDASGPFFSPDGQFIAFFAGGKLKKASVQGGGAVVLCDAQSDRGGSWGDDGNIVAALTISGPLFRVSSSGGTPQALTSLRQENSELTHRYPQALPGSQAVLFTAHTSTSGGYEAATIEILSLRTGKRKTLVRGGYFGQYVPSGHLLYIRQGTLYAAPLDVGRQQLTGPATPVLEDVASTPQYGFAQLDVARNGTLVYVKGRGPSQTLVWLDSTGRTQPLRGVAAEYGSPLRFSPDGKRLAVTVTQDGNTEVWVYDLERDVMTRLTFTPGFSGWPVWAPDGKHIVFTSSRNNAMANLYWVRADGTGEAVRLAEGKYRQTPLSFSPDGRRLAFTESNPETKLDIWTLPLEEVESDHPKAGKPEPFLQTSFNEAAPKISPDGRWLAYGSDESGASEIYVRPFPGPGGKWQVSAGGGRMPVWSKKAPELFYQNLQGMMVVSYTAKVGAFVATKPRLWVEKKDLGLNFDLAPDGKRFAVVQAEAEPRGAAQVTFLFNFFDELRWRAPAGK